MSSTKIKKVDSNLTKHEKIFRGQPEISFFKKVYKKISSFNINIIEQDLIGNIDFGNIINCELNKSGDLLKNLYLEVLLPDLEKPTNSTWYGYTNNIGCNIIKTITFKINDQVIERLHGEWIDIYNELNNINVDHLTKQYNSEYSLRNTNNTIDIDKRQLYIPIPFFFTKDTGSALPLISLTHSSISIDIEFRNLKDIIKINNYNLINNIKKKTSEKLSCKLFTELVYLDDTEKKLFTNRNLEYLIETVQYNNEDFLNKTDLYKNIYVDFRYLIKELIWVITVDSSNLDTTLQNDHNNITTYTTKYSNYKDTFDTLQIKLDNIEIVDEKAEYFRKIQSNFYHNKTLSKKHIYSYSFAINPLLYQPSGYINFSNIKESIFSFKFKDYKLKEKGSSTNGIIKIYGINYNILKIVSGIGSLLYTV